MSGGGVHCHSLKEITAVEQIEVSQGPLKPHNTQVRVTQPRTQRRSGQGIEA